MLEWTYNNSAISSHNDLPKEVVSFVYILYFTDGTKYIGKKDIRSERRIKPTKAQLAIRKNYRRVEIKELPFANYVGSSKENKDKDLIAKEILHLCTNKRTSTYLEVKELMTRGALESDDYTNANINGKWFSNCLDGLLEIKEYKKGE